MKNLNTIKVISLNIWLGGLLFDEIIEFLKQEDPDILMLQEVYNGDNSLITREHRSLSFLQENLDYPYFHFAPAFLENIVKETDKEAGKKIEQGNAIFSKFPIQEKAIRFFDIPFGERIDKPDYYHLTPRNMQHILIDLPFLGEKKHYSNKDLAGTSKDLKTKKLHVINIHGIWGKHGDDTDRRLKMADSILDEIGTNQPLLLAGDTNINPDTETVRKIEKRLKSVFGNELKTSFNLSRKDLKKDPGYAASAVDMMFVSKDIKVTSKNCPNVDVSDHLPLVVELEIR